MKKNQKILLAAAVGSIALGSLAYFLQTNKAGSSKADLNKLERDDVIKILKALNKEFFHVFTNFSMVSSQIKQQSMGRASPQDIRMILLEQPMFRGEIENIENSVYQKYGITKEEFQQVLESKFKEDPEIQQLQKNMKDSFDKSFLGVPPEIKTDIPNFLTPAKVVEILRKVMTSSVTVLNEKLLELLEAGESLDYNNPKLMQVMQQLRMDPQKDQILKEYQLDQYEENPNKILQYATQVYSQSNKDGFIESMKYLETNYQQLVQQLLTKGPMTSNQIQQIMNRETRPAVSNPFYGMRGSQGPAPKVNVEEEANAVFSTEKLQPKIEEKAEEVKVPQVEEKHVEKQPEHFEEKVEKLSEKQPDVVLKEEKSLEHFIEQPQNLDQFAGSPIEISPKKVEKEELLPEHVEKKLPEHIEKVELSPEHVEKIEKSPLDFPDIIEVVQLKEQQTEQRKLSQEHEKVSKEDHSVEKAHEEHH